MLSPRFRTTVPALLLFAGALVAAPGCETVGNNPGEWWETAKDIVVGGVVESEDFQDGISALIAAQDDAKRETNHAYDEIVALLDTPAEELDTQYAKASAAIVELQARANAMVAQFDDVKLEADAYLDEALAKFEEDIHNTVLRAQAQRTLDLVKQEYAVIFEKAGELTVDLEPVVQSMDSQMALLQQNLNDAGIAELRENLDGVKEQVDGAIGDIEDRDKALDDLTGQLQALDLIFQQLAATGS